MVEDFKFMQENYSLYADEIIGNTDPLFHDKVKSKVFHLMDCIEYTVHQIPKDLRKKCTEIQKRRKLAQEDAEKKSQEMIEDAITPMEGNGESTNQEPFKEVNESTNQEPLKETMEHLLLEPIVERFVDLDLNYFQNIFDDLMKHTQAFDIPKLDRIYCEIYETIYQFKDDWDKSQLLEKFQNILKK
jgi:hypothetical protein